MEPETLNRHPEPRRPGLFDASNVGRSVRIYLPATLIYRGMSFLRGIVLAWLLARQTGQYGLLSIALQAINILAPLISLGLPEAVTRYVPGWQQKKNLGSFLKLSAILTMGITLTATLGLIFFSHPIGQALFAGKDIPLTQIPPLTLATFFAILAITAYFLVVAVLKGLRLFGALAVMELFHGTLFLILSLAAVLVLGPQAQWVIWSYTLAMIVPTVLWTWAIVRRVPGARESEEKFHTAPLVRRLVKFGFWAAMGGIVWQSWQLYSLWHLTRFYDALSSDIFAAARLIGQLLAIVGAAVGSVILTHICVIWEKGDRPGAGFLHDFYTKLVVLGLIFLGLILIALREPLARVFPHTLSQVSDVLPEVLLFYQYGAILGLLAIRFMVIEKMRLLFWPWLAGLIANVLLSAAVIRPDSALSGAAHAATWSTWAALIVALLLLRAEKQHVSPGLLVLIVSSAILLLPILPATGLFIALVIWTLWGSTLFDPAQKKILLQKLRRQQ